MIRIMILKKGKSIKYANLRFLSTITCVDVCWSARTVKCNMISNAAFQFFSFVTAVCVLFLLALCKGY